MASAILAGQQALETAFDRAFGAAANPWRHLGGIAYLLFWVVAATGIYIYIGFDTRADGAYASVERLSANAWPFGALARSLHRYASDAFLLVTLLHLAREWIRGRYAHFRRFSWTTGVVTLWLLFASGIGGFWLVWDRLAQYSLIATAEWLDVLPGFDGALVRNFIATDAVSDRLFSLLIFLHIGLPLALLGAMWIHVQRLSQPATSPPRPLVWGTLAALGLLALARPVGSDAAANLAVAPGTLALDWFYLGVHAFADATSPVVLWLVAVGATAMLLALPWVAREARTPRPVAARVDLANCNGCGRCFADCPYAAVTMAARTDGRPLVRQAVVDADLCAGCGICAGACPSSTPFRSAAELVTGIDLPQAPVAALRATLEAELARLAGSAGGPQPARVMVFGCHAENGGVRPRGTCRCAHRDDRARLRGPVAAVVRRVRAAHARRRRAGHRLPRRRLRLPSRQPLDDRPARGGAGAAPARPRFPQRACASRGQAAARSGCCTRHSPHSAQTSRCCRPTVHPCADPNVWRSPMKSFALPRLLRDVPATAATRRDADRYTLAVPRDARARLALGWLTLGVGTLAASGLLAVLLVLSRTPGLARLFPVADFFHVALVAHVDLSVLVWFVAFAGVLWSLNSTPRALAAGWFALTLATGGAVLIAVAPFTGGTPIMANYVPVIESPLFLAGLLLFGAGMAALVARGMFASPLVGIRLDGAGALRFGLNGAIVVTAIALLALAWSYVAVPAGLDGKAYYELLFWGAGHVLQFAWTLLMLVAWLILADAVGLRLPLSPRVVALLFGVGLAAVFATPLIYLAWNVASVEHHRLHTWLMRFGGGLAITPVAAAILWALVRGNGTPEPRRDAAQRPLAAALVTSMVLFGAGGLIGFAISGNNVKVPAHYHGAIVGVTIAMMGTVYWLLPRLGFAAPPPRLATWQAYLYGGGQLMHIVGLVWSGGYGVQRKVADGALAARSLEQTLGMGLMGAGGLVAIIGGMLFVLAVAHAVFRRPAARLAHG